MPAGTPIFIDSSVYPHFPEPQNQCWGPWLYDGEMYVLLAEELAVTGTSFFRVYKRAVGTSDDTGWSEVDSAGHPEMNYAVGGCWFDASTNIIHAVYVHSGTTYIRQFSLVSGSWGSPVDSFSDEAVNDFLHVRMSGSDYVLYFSADAGSGADAAYWRKYSGGSWSSAERVSTNISTSSAVSTSQVVVDDDGLFHLMWREPGSASVKLYARTLNPSSGALGTIQEVTPSAKTVIVPGFGCEWNNKVVAAYSWRDLTAVTQQGRVRISLGSPTTSPTWTDDLVATDEDAVTGICAVPYNGNLFVWWCTTNSIRYAFRQPLSAWQGPFTWYSWSDKQYYSSDGNTLEDWPGSNFLHNLTVQFVSGAGWQMVVGGLV